MNLFKNVITCCVAYAAMACAATDSVAHRFLYSDFMNRKIVYVDETKKDAYKEAFLPEVAFDLTRCWPNRLVVAQRYGCRLRFGRRFLRRLRGTSRRLRGGSAAHGSGMEATDSDYRPFVPVEYHPWYKSLSL